MSSLQGDDAREFLEILRTIRDAGLDPTVISVENNELTDDTKPPK